jgi:hypothetical protein
MMRQMVTSEDIERPFHPTRHHAQDNLKRMCGRALSPLVRYAAYAQGLQRMATEANPPSELSVQAALDGEPSRTLRRLYSIERLRGMGAFFTGPSLAAQLVAPLRQFVTGDDGRLFDPACGVGDLLLASAANFPVSSCGAQATLDAWSRRLIGTDIQAEFVTAANARLALLARHRHGLAKGDNLGPSFGVLPIADTRDCLSLREWPSGVAVVVMNPPFNAMPAPEGCEWAEGAVSAAAVFVDRVLSISPPGARFGFLLPDVLRSGSRYESWREHFRTLAEVTSERTAGVFDRHTDVDVFLVWGRRRAKTGRIRPARTATTNPAARRLIDLFDLSVGPVVPHRDPTRGPWTEFIHARSVPQWGECRHRSEHRRCLAKTFPPPFVVVRRTSRPGDKHRACASIIRGRKRIAVENHLIILVPKSRNRLWWSRRLLQVLRSERTRRWLDRRIRCRHLTVRALSQLPWWPDRHD